MSTKKLKKITILIFLSCSVCAIDFYIISQQPKIFMVNRQTFKWSVGEEELVIQNLMGGQTLV